MARSSDSAGWSWTSRRRRLRDCPQTSTVVDRTASRITPGAGDGISGSVKMSSLLPGRL